MRRSKFRRPCKVLIFNGARVLVAIVRSLHCAAELTHENKSAIHNCCTGKSFNTQMTIQKRTENKCHLGRVIYLRSLESFITKSL